MKKTMETRKGKCTITLPDLCPRCGLGMAPDIVASGQAIESDEFGVVLSCPICKKIFFSLHSVRGDEYSSIYSSEDGIYPYRKSQPQIPPDMSRHYPEFYKLYEQASEAERHGLNGIVGMAYRKALETLVKTYLIEKTPSEKDEILSEALGKSVARISYNNIQTLAKAASWIGNDKTHMVQKHPDYTVSDMKNFILPLCHLILSEKSTEQALSLLGRK